MQRRDYAGAAKLVTMRATLDGLDALGGAAEGMWRTEAERAYGESVAAWRAEREASARRRQERDVAALVAILAEALEEKRRDRAAGGRPVIGRRAA
jgi:hypothetical protein